MAQLRYANIVPFGKCTVSAAGTPTLLSVNCGPLSGQVEGTNYLNPAVPGTACQQFTLQADVSNGGNLYLMPRGKTAAGNPEAIFCVLGPGASVPFPFSGANGPGLVPENFAMDSDAGGGVFYGYGALVG